MKKSWLLLVCAAGLYTSALAQDTIPDAKRIQGIVNYLASDKLKGRGTAEKGGLKASRYVAKQFKKLGLKTVNGSSYFQDFTFNKNAHKDIPSRNVIGFLDNGADRTIIIGAHYDHLGTAALFDGKYPVGQIHNGADDNASGVAGLLELARYYVHNHTSEPFNFLFIAFGGEELGLQGSKYYTAHPLMPLDKMHFMLNMDMIGRYNPERGIGIGGYGSAAEWPVVFKEVQQPGIKFFTDAAGKGASDHHNFYVNGVPVMFFHTGGHDDYHKPTDDAPKLQAAAEANIIRLEIQLINRAMTFPELHYLEQKA
ncbi:M20/M25/M40 family metallo-hydrolase [Chitinophaga polysaccharea]|uniref:M20/M25/M40 family metallo-hydrolase n=1 Tax=Chitinophaga polysaccharea TaxID=1293035 RepID=UPI0014552673|nr:M20/M25/M40 family metallo-hydrolase [Chitinophaga polysaccharea]NLR56996.1 M20/M25/M40 family metallo-hydrolase [Chitinophaga polysaccharea]